MSSTQPEPILRIEGPREKGQRSLHGSVKVRRYGRVRYLSGPAVLALGLVLFVVGVVTDGIAVAAIGIVVLLTGLYARSRQA